MNLLPTSLKALCYTMIAINFATCAVCGIWLFLYREASPVKVAQPQFLGLVLFGCLISTSTIFALVQEDDGSDGHGEADLPACQAIPWLYSVGFSITFGSLFAKILRVYRLFKAAATMQRVTISANDTFKIIGGVLMVDVVLLTVWTIVDPLEWHRESLTEDKFGSPLSSEGFCVSDHWAIFAGLIAAFHLLLMGVACYMCYMARDIPTEFSEGKYVCAILGVHGDSDACCNDAGKSHPIVPCLILGYNCDDFKPTDLCSRRARFDHSRSRLPNKHLRPQRSDLDE